MGVAHIGGLAVHVPQDQIGGFPSHAGEGGEILHIVGDLPTESLQKLLGTGHQILGFSIVEPTGVDVFAYLPGVRRGEGFQRGKPGEQRRCHQIHPGVGALGGQPHGEKQLIIFLILQRTQPLRVQLLQFFDDPQGGRLVPHGAPPMYKNGVILSRILWE